MRLTCRPWRETSIESLLLHGDDEELEIRTVTLAQAASAAEAVRIARFLNHLLVGHPATTPIIFKLLAICLERTVGTSHIDTVKSIIFSSETFKDYCVTERGNEYRDCEPLCSIISGRELMISATADCVLS